MTVSLEGLLSVQAHDTSIAQLRHRSETLPERAELARIDNTLAALETKVSEVAAARDAVARRQQAAEDEIALLGEKIAEVDKRLYSGTVTSPRELQAMQADIDALKRQQSGFEDTVLEAMEEREPLDAELQRLDAERAALDEEAVGFRVRLAEAEATIEAEIAVEQAARDGAAAQVPPALLTQYERLRTTLGGIAVARLDAAGRCGGCHLTLPAAEFARIKREPPDTLVLCDQCGRILVRS